MRQQPIESSSCPLALEVYRRLHKLLARVMLTSPLWKSKFLEGHLSIASWDIGQMWKIIRPGENLTRRKVRKTWPRTSWQKIVISMQLHQKQNGTCCRNDNVFLPGALPCQRWRSNSSHWNHPLANRQVLHILPYLHPTTRFMWRNSTWEALNCYVRNKLHMTKFLWKATRDKARIYLRDGAHAFQPNWNW